MIAPPVVELQALRRTFPGNIVALEGLDLTVRRGEMVAIMGTSGSGKSSLLNLLGCLDRPTSGTYRLDGVEVESLDDDALADLVLRMAAGAHEGLHRGADRGGVHVADGA